MKKISIYILAILSMAGVAMSAPLTAPRQTGMAIGTQIILPVYANTIIYGGSMVAVNSTGYAVPASDTAGLKVIGRAEVSADNHTGSSGDITIMCRCGWFLWDASVGDKVKSNIGQIAYVSDDHTVTVSTSGSNKIIAGLVVDYDTVKSQLVVDSLYAASSVAASISSLAVSGNAAVGGTLGVTGNTTLSSNVTPSLLTASKPVFTDANKMLVSGTTGTAVSNATVGGGVLSGVGVVVTNATVGGGALSGVSVVVTNATVSGAALSGVNTVVTNGSVGAVAGVGTNISTTTLEATTNGTISVTLTLQYGDVVSQVGGVGGDTVTNSVLTNCLVDTATFTPSTASVLASATLQTGNITPSLTLQSGTPVVSAPSITLQTGTAVVSAPSITLQTGTPAVSAPTITLETGTFAKP